MNPTILPAVCKLDRLGSLTLVWQPVLEKENYEFKPGGGWALPGYATWVAPHWQNQIMGPARKNVCLGS